MGLKDGCGSFGLWRWKLIAIIHLMEMDMMDGEGRNVSLLGMELSSRRHENTQRHTVNQIGDGLTMEIGDILPISTSRKSNVRQAPS